MKNIFEILKQPFHYDDYGQMIFDKENNLVLDVRAWGIIQREENAEEIQDNFGKMVAEALNKISYNHTDGTDTPSKNINMKLKLKEAYIDGYETGHNDTVESGYGSAEDKADDWIDEHFITDKGE